MRSGLLLLSLLLLLGCRKAMEDDGRILPLQRSNFFKNGATARMPVPGTVPRGAFDEDTLFRTGEVDGKLAGGFPMPVTMALLERGQERFNIFCALCHGRVGDGKGIIVARGFPAPETFHQERLRQAPPGYFFGVITRGYGVMPSYGDRIPPADRWSIIAYIRALQLSQNAPLEEVYQKGALP